MTKIDKKEIIVSTVKSIFGTIPFGGTALNELFFEYNGRIKQKRLNKFVEILSESFTEDSGINLENIQTEDFSDLFESVLRRVVRTKSEQKLIRFKDILIKQLNYPSEHTELNDHYLELISNLTEQEISILHNHRFFTIQFEDEINKLNSLKTKKDSWVNMMRREGNDMNKSRHKGSYEESRLEYEKQKEYIDSYTKYKEANYYKFTENEFLFYKQRLSSKGLLIDNRMNRIGNLPFIHMGITEFGSEFIDFIKSKEQ